MIDPLCPPMQCVNARQQLAEGKGLGQIIVAAAAQSADTIVHLGQGAQDQDRCALAGFAQHLDDSQPIDIARQHAVHDDDIIRLAGRQEHAVAAVAGMIRRVSGFLQAFDDELRDALVILDQQNFHGCSPSGVVRIRRLLPPARLRACFLRRRPRILALNSSRYR